MTKLRSLEMLRGCAALLVVLFHTEAIFAQATGRMPFHGMFSAESRGVDLFFVLSGFVMTYVHFADWGRPARLGNYFFNRFSRIYPGVWVMSAFALATYAFGFGGADKQAKLDPWNIVTSLLLVARHCEVPERGMALVNVTWTLKYEIAFYCIFSLLIVNRRLGTLALGLWQGVILLLFITGVAKSGSPCEAFYLRPVCLEFGIGILCALIVIHRPRFAVLGGLPVSGLALALGLAIFIGGLVVDTRRPPGAPELQDFLVFGTSAGLIIASLSKLELSARLQIPELPVRVGGASYAIYLVHFSVISLIASAMVKLGAIPRDDTVLLVVGLAGVSAGFAFDRFVDQPIQRALRQFRKKALGNTTGGQNSSQSRADEGRLPWPVEAIAPNRNEAENNSGISS